VARADSITEVGKQLIGGNYSSVISTLQREISDGAGGEERHLLLSRALLAVGKYEDAYRQITNALELETQSIRLRWQAREVFLSSGHPDKARDMVDEIVRRVSSGPEDYRNADNMVVFGQAALLKNADPKRVLDQLLESARKSEPKLRDVYLAAGNLALDKHDFKLAAEKFEAGLKQLPEDPDIRYGLARAYEPSDAAVMGDAIEKALAANSNHVGCLLLLVDNHVDAEDYEEAEKCLDRINNINPWHPDAWAYRAVLAHLRNQPNEEEAAREAGLKFAPMNPRVDYLIGHKLSQKYRFAEGSTRQRRALEFDPQYLPAKAQLAQDLLRLGDEKEGWELADAVQKEDGYDVQAFNLMNLHQTMSKYATLTNGDFVLRMDKHEAAIYGDRALELLTSARAKLSAKYGIELKRPTIVEIFAAQPDFAVRTFGMPGNPGFLGVCFGNLVTANSPAAQRGHAVNWQAVLYHEFCHVVTLQMTQNKMPRWLSEGISVYEETQADPSWGQQMTPDYREMVLGAELTPISRLSGAFLSPKSDEHLQFAYYESSLVVEFLVKQYGMEKLKAILIALGKGDEINQVIATNTAPMEKLEGEFARFAGERAEKLGPALDWEKPETESLATRRGNRAKPSKSSTTTTAPVAAPFDWDTWAKERPTNYWVLKREAEQLVEDKNWSKARNSLEALLKLYPDWRGPGSGYLMLALACRNLRETNQERATLAAFAKLDDEAPNTYMRLMELGAEVGDWPAVNENAHRYLAVNPLVARPYRYLAQAAEKSGDTKTGISSWRAILQLDPPDPAEAHFRLAELLHRTGDASARRHVLQALEEAPRYPDALRLLLEMNRPASQANANAAIGK
jgi:tetratricopeptide (TPR) repeat protein